MIRKFLLLCFLVLSLNSYSQATLYVIVNSGNSFTDCSDSPFSSGDPKWSLQAAGGSVADYGSSCSSGFPDTIYAATIYCPQSTINMTFEAYEGDDAPCYLTKECAETTTQSFSVPFNPGMSENHNISIFNSGGNDSWGSANFTISVEGTYMNNGSTFFNTCNSVDLGQLSQGSLLGDATQSSATAACGTVYYRFSTGNNVPEFFDVLVANDPENIGMNGDFTVNIYESNGSCSGTLLQSVTGGYQNDTTVRQRCLEPNTQYFVSISGTNAVATEDQGFFGVQITGSLQGLPDDTNPVSISGTTICSGDSIAVTVDATDLNTIYYLEQVGSGFIDGPYFGNGGSITFDSVVLTNLTGSYYLNQTFQVAAHSMNGYSVDLNANNEERIEFSNPTTTYGNDLTVEAWVYLESPTNSVPWMGQSLSGMDAMNSNVWIWHSAGANSNDITWFVNDGGTWRSLTSSGLTGLTGWHHIATVAGASGQAIYIDGALNASSSTGISSGIQVSPSSSLHIGNDPRYPDDPGYHGDYRIGEFRVWDVERSASELEANMYACLNGSESGLLLYNLMGEGTGSTVTSTTGANGSFSTSMNPLNAWLDGMNFCENTCGVNLMETVSVDIIRPLNPVFTNATQTQCSGNNVSIFSYGNNTAVTADRVYYDNNMVEIGAFPLNVSVHNFDLGPLASGNYTYYVADRLAGCESPPTALDLTVLATPSQPTITSSSTVCEGEDVVIEATGSGTGNIVFLDGNQSILATVAMGGNPLASLNNGSLPAGSYTFYVYEDDGTCQSTLDSIEVTVGAGLSFSNLLAQNPFCNGSSDGSIQIVIAGGSGNFGYSIDAGATSQTSNIFFSLGPDSYDIVVIDSTSGCQIDTMITLTEPTPVVSLPPQIIGLECSGDVADTVIFSASGGAGLYSYGGPIIGGLIDWTDPSQALFVAPGSYELHTTDGNGCVSVDSFTIVDPAPITGIDVVSSCNSYTWIDGNSYTSSNNTATHVLTSVSGCDSTVTLNLTLNTSTTSTDVVTACDSYTWIDGNTYTSSNNTATYTIANAVGCDSIITLNLTLNSSTTATDVVTACDSYTWIDGNTYTSSNNTATHTIANALGCDSVITLDLTINTTTTSTDVVTACDSYTWIDGNTYTSSNSTATHILQNSTGCDSIVTLDLTIETVDVSVTTIDFTISATASGASYQWIDCDNNNAPIAGETNQSFTAAVNGNYAVIVTENNCTDTSVCVPITNVGIDALEKQPFNVSIYPQPADELIIIALNTMYQNVELQLITSDGRVVNQTSLKSVQETSLDVSKLSSGIYLLRITTEENELIERIMIK